MIILKVLDYKNQPQVKPKKPGPKVIPAISSKTLEELLDSLADIIIERITEEAHKGNFPIQPQKIENQQYGPV